MLRPSPGSHTTTSKRKLLLLGCGFEQIEALRVARELGYRTIAFDNDARAAGREFADEFVRVDLKNSAALLGQAECVAPDGVFVHAAELAVEAAYVSESLGLPGLGLEAARNATDKHLRIKKLSANGIRTPRFEIVAAAAPLGEWLSRTELISYPKILKPTNQAGARGVQQISSRAELEAYYHERDLYGSDHFVCEERLLGVQLSTESISLDGKIVHHAIALRHYETTSNLLPFFIEDGHSLPYALPGEEKAAVESVIERSFDHRDRRDRRTGDGRSHERRSFRRYGGPPWNGDQYSLPADRNGDGRLVFGRLVHAETRYGCVPTFLPPRRTRTRHAMAASAPTRRTTGRRRLANG